MAPPKKSAASTLPRMFPIAEIAEMFGRAPRQIRSWIADGRLQVVKVGNAVFIPQAQIDTLLSTPNTPKQGSPKSAKLGRQIRNLLELIKDGHGSPAMARELREIEERQQRLEQEIASAGTAEPVPVLHPNLPALYRRKVETLQEALRDATTAAAATEALRSLVDAILVSPGERRGEVSVELRGALAAFLDLSEADDAADTRTAAPRKGNG